MISLHPNYLIRTGVVFLFALLIGCGTTTQTIQQTSPNIDLSKVTAGRFDNGKMWTFDYPPVDYFEEAYNFRPSQEWLDDVRMSALRIPGCTASFVSPNGLVMTNHHCARSHVETISKENEDLLTNGFYAPTLADERKAEGLYADQLVKIEDVTDQILKAVSAAKTDEEKVSLRQKTIKELSQKLSDESELRCDIISLYNGARFSAYYYKRYNDVRVVFVPELQIGFFGGDYDNFTYPRYCLDCSFFRVYDDDGKPLKTEHYFAWSPDGAKEGEPVFVIGNPGSTDRLTTVAQLEYERDYNFPFISDLLNAAVRILEHYADNHPDKAPEMRNRIFGLANAQKAYNGMLKGLRDEVLMAKRQDFERKFRTKVENDARLNAEYGELWEKISSNVSQMKKYFNDSRYLRMQGLGTSNVFGIAASIARYAIQMELPEEARRKEYQGKSAKLMKKRILRDHDIDMELDKEYLAFQLQQALKRLGPDDPFVVATLGSLSPKTAAENLLNTTKVLDKDYVEKLLDGGPDAIRASDDPLIKAALIALPRATKASKAMNKIDKEQQILFARLGRALFEVYGTSIPPDATFTLRIADGVVKGYDYNGTVAPTHTTFYGLYNRYYSHNKKGAWDLPDRWKNPPPDFDLSTELDMVSTNDIIGGNSGSAMINTKKQVVGLVFDGNIESLPGRFIFDDTLNRTVSVHSNGIIKALRHIYKADRIANELRTGILGK
ncbi:MAG: S46 family peptidase [Chlorobi bacterium]|nr:S46 family peptidase [Chlorobiota bacterium]